MKKAFTIVELLVVMAVIGVLISLSIVGVQAVQKAQRETSRLTDLSNIQGALESYFQKYERYPLQQELGTTYVAAYSPTSPSNLLSKNLLGEVNAVFDIPGNGGPQPQIPPGGQDPQNPGQQQNPGVGQHQYNPPNAFAIYNGETQISTLPMQSLGSTIMNSAYSTETCEFSPVSAHFGKADTWWIGYTATGPTPQKYGLYACTESGKTKNFGVKNDAGN
ncbi:MAG: type II secretion system protein [bacterium]